MSEGARRASGDEHGEAGASARSKATPPRRPDRYEIRRRALIALAALGGIFLSYALTEPFVPALSVPPVIGTRIAYTVAFFALAWTVERLERALWATVVFFVATLVARVAIQALLNSRIGVFRGWHASEVLLDYSYPACLLAAAAVWVSLKGKRIRSGSRADQGRDV